MVEAATTGHTDQSASTSGSRADGSALKPGNCTILSWISLPVFRALGGSFDKLLNTRPGALHLIKVFLYVFSVNVRCNELADEHI